MRWYPDVILTEIKKKNNQKKQNKTKTKGHNKKRNLVLLVSSLGLFFELLM